MTAVDPPKKRSAPRVSKSTLVVFALLARLGQLEERQEGASLAGLAERMDMNEETLRPYLNGLINQRKVYQDEDDGRYYLDPDGPPVRSYKADGEKIRSILEQFTADTTRDVALAVLADDGLRLPVYVKPIDGPELIADLPPDSAHCTAAGHALLSKRSVSYVRRYFRRIGMPRFTDATPATLEELLPQLEPGPRGIWSARGQYCTDGACIAVLAHDTRYRNTRFALTTSLRAADYDLQKHHLRDRLLQAAGELQTVIGPFDI